MSTSKSLIVQLVWTTLICGQVLVSAIPQNSTPNAETPQSKPRSDDYRDVIAVGKTKGFELKQGYSFNIANSPDGSPYSSGWAYLGGRAGSGPAYYRDNTAFPLLDQVWSGNVLDVATGSLYVVAAAVAFSSLWYTFSPFFTGKSSPPAKKSPTEVKVSKPAEIKDETAVKEKGDETQVAPSAKDVTKKELPKSRRRRSLPKNTVVTVDQSDADLTRLASIVLNAIASGECLQKTICQLGTQIGESPKGRLAFSLVDTLLPTSVHINQLFITMKKALRGDNTCERFNCQYQTYS